MSKITAAHKNCIKLYILMFGQERPSTFSHYVSYSSVVKNVSNKSSIDKVSILLSKNGSGVILSYLSSRCPDWIVTSDQTIFDCTLAHRALELRVKVSA